MPVQQCGENGFQWGKNGVCFTGANAKEKAEAVGKAIHAQDSGFFTTDKKTFKATIDEETGFLTAHVTLARTGIQFYQGFELGLTDRALDSIGVYRPPEEVFSPDSIKSFINLTVTDEHPSGIVNVDNVKELQKGQVSDVKRDGDYLIGIVTITDKYQIEKIKDGKIEVSVGYKNDLKEKSGVYNGDSYEYVQTNILPNHLALVGAGRCGSACKLTMDNKKEKGMIITIDGIQFNVEDDQLAQAIQKQQSANDAEKEEMKKKLDQAEEEKEEMEKKKDKAEASKDALEKSTLDSDQLNKHISDRAILIVDARAILGDKMPECVDCPKEIMSAVVDHVLGLDDLSAKSDDYISAAYDMAVKKVKDAKGSLDSLSNDFANKEIVTDVAEARNNARIKYAKDHLGLEVK